MKLGELKSLIRSRKGNPSLFAPLKPGADLIAVTVQKASILEALDVMFPGGRSTETYLRLNDEGQIIDDGAPLNSAQPAAGEADDLDSLDDLDAPAAADDLDEIDEL